MEPILNRSGLTQVYYVGNISKRVRPGEAVPAEHLEKMGEDAIAGLRGILSEPREPVRPGPALRQMVPVAGLPERRIPVGMPRSPAALRASLASRPTILVDVDPADALPGWLASVAVRAGTVDPLPASVRWVMGGEAVVALKVEGEGAGIALADAMRVVLRGGVRSGLSLRSGDVEPVREKAALIVMTTFNAPRWEREAIRSMLTDADMPVIDLIVIDDASAPAAATQVIEQLTDCGPVVEPGDVCDDGPNGTVTLYRAEHAETMLPAGSSARFAVRETNVGYTANVNFGGTFYDPDRHDMVIFLNGDTLPGRGWVRALRRAMESGPKVGFVNPLSNENVGHSVPLPSGCAPDDFADALLVTFDGEYPEAFCPSGFCLAVRGEVWERFGPFDETLWGRGYGEETHLELVALKEEGWTSRHAPDAFVFHARSRSHTDNASHERSRDAFRKIQQLHGPWFDREHRSFLSRDTFAVRVRQRAAALARLPGSPSRSPDRRVMILAKNATLTGGMIALVRIADALRARGWDAVVVTFDPRDSDLYDSTAAFAVYDGESDLRRNFRREFFSEGHLIVGSWTVCDVAQRFCIDGGFKPVLYSQDDERRFDFNRDKKGLIEEMWRTFPVVANSPWVAAEMAPFANGVPEVIPVGVDLGTFFPRQEEERPEILRVCSMYRGETRWRGSDVFLEGIRHARSLGVPLHVTAYGSKPPPGSGVDVSTGRLPTWGVARVLQGADVYVDASRFQGFGMDALQAQACGTGLVCTDNGGSQMYASDGLTAVVVRPEDPRAIGEALKTLHEDRALLRKIRTEGAAQAHAFSWDTVALAWENHLDSLSETP
jgi:glycosyltransferase involved in cell wall biosynthesis